MAKEPLAVAIRSKGVIWRAGCSGSRSRWPESRDPKPRRPDPELGRPELEQLRTWSVATGDGASSGWAQHRRATSIAREGDASGVRRYVGRRRCSRKSLGHRGTATGGEVCGEAARQREVPGAARRQKQKQEIRHTKRIRRRDSPDPATRGYASAREEK